MGEWVAAAAAARPERARGVVAGLGMLAAVLQAWARGRRRRRRYDSPDNGWRLGANGERRKGEEEAVGAMPWLVEARREEEEGQCRPVNISPDAVAVSWVK